MCVSSRWCPGGLDRVCCASAPKTISVVTAINPSIYGSAVTFIATLRLDATGTMGESASSASGQSGSFRPTIARSGLRTLGSYGKTFLGHTWLGGKVVGRERGIPWIHS